MGKKKTHYENYPKVTGDYARQRAERGWSGRDSWSFDSYLCHLLSSYFDAGDRTLPGRPGKIFYKGVTYVDAEWTDHEPGDIDDEFTYASDKKMWKVWRKSIKLMADGFRMGTLDSFWSSDDNGWDKIDEALEHLRHNFGALWN